MYVCATHVVPTMLCDAVFLRGDTLHG